MTAANCDSGSGARLGTAGDGRGDSGVGVGGEGLQRTAGERRRHEDGCRVCGSGKVQGQLKAEMQGAARDS